MDRHLSRLLRITTLVLPILSLQAAPETPMQLLRDFDLSSEAPKWIAQNDGVMGGVSTGGAKLADGRLHFTGELSLENNGGFAQVYSPTNTTDFSAFDAVRLRVKGDGRTYQFRIATDARYRGSRIAYRSEFGTEAGQWIEVTLPFEAFEPSHHGRRLEGPAFDPASVHEIAFLLADGQAGAFSLEIDWIGLIDHTRSASE